MWASETYVHTAHNHHHQGIATALYEEFKMDQGASGTAREDILGTKEKERERAKGKIDWEEPHLYEMTNYKDT